MQNQYRGGDQRNDFELIPHVGSFTTKAANNCPTMTQTMDEKDVAGRYSFGIIGSQVGWSPQGKKKEAKQEYGRKIVGNTKIAKMGGEKLTSDSANNNTNPLYAFD